MEAIVLHMKCMPSMSSQVIVEQTRSPNLEVAALITAVTEDKESFQMESANIAMLSPREWRPIHSIVLLSFVARDRNYFLQDNVSSVHHSLLQGDSIALSKSVT